MSVSMMQRLFGTQPKTVVHTHTTTEVTHDPGSRFNLRTALRNAGIGAGVAGALGGASLLLKTALPLVGKVGSVAGLGRLIGVGGALGAATAAIPLLAPIVRDNPAARSAAIGAGIGAAAGFVLPLVPTSLGAIAGAGIGLAVHAMKNRPQPTWQQYPGFDAYPGWVPVQNQGAWGMYGSPVGMNPYVAAAPFAGAMYGANSIPAANSMILPMAIENAARDSNAANVANVPAAPTSPAVPAPVASPSASSAVPATPVAPATGVSAGIVPTLTGAPTTVQPVASSVSIAPQILASPSPAGTQPSSVVRVNPQV